MGNEFSLKFDRRLTLFTVLSCGFVVSLVLCNIVGGKLFEVQVGELTLLVSAGLLPMPLTFILGGLLHEYFGERATKVVSWTAVGLCVLMFGMMVAVGQISFAALTAESSWTGVDAASFDKVFLSSQRITVGSVLAFSAAQVVQISLLSGLQRLFRGRSFAVRTSIATIGSQALDTVLVETLAWAGMMSTGQIVSVIATSFAMKVVLAVGMGPLTEAARFFLEAYLSGARRIPADPVRF